MCDLTEKFIFSLETEIRYTKQVGQLTRKKICQATLLIMWFVIVIKVVNNIVGVVGWGFNGRVEDFFKTT